MKILKRLNIDRERIMKDDELISIRGGDLRYYCCCWACFGCGPTCGPAYIPEGVDPNLWAAQQGGYDLCSCVGGY